MLSGSCPTLQVKSQVRAAARSDSHFTRIGQQFSSLFAALPHVDIRQHSFQNVHRLRDSEDSSTGIECKGVEVGEEMSAGRNEVDHHIGFTPRSDDGWLLFDL